ncbi:MAG: hypothetical protein ACJ8DJ_13395, partial [Gemmatimonadales bacterium]
MTREEAATLARERLGLEAAASPLPGEHDRNFLLEESGGTRHLLKLLADPEATALQDAALEWLAQSELRVGVPRLERTDDGLRLLSWVPGTPWAATGPHGPDALRSLGRAVADVDRALAGFEHPDLGRRHPWNLLEAPAARAAVA